MSFEKNSVGIRIVHDSGKFVGVITNGDLRRSFLTGISKNSKASEITNSEAITVDESADDHEVENLMRKFGIVYIPVLSENGNISTLKQYSSFTNYEVTDAAILFMAGGKGTRLLGETEHLPKPLVRVQGKPILEHLIGKAYLQGFRKIIISVGHLGYKIEEYFEDGNDLNVEISYLRESEPLGTAGALSLLQKSDIKIPENFIVANADVISGIDLRAFLNYHIDSKSTASIVGKRQETQIPYGVLTISDGHLLNIEEKPTQSYLINAGLYAFNSKIIDELKSIEALSMPELLQRLIKSNHSISVFQNEDDWIDIGTPETLSFIRER